MEVFKISNTKIGTFESVFIILTIVVARSSLSLARHLVSTTKSATLLNLVFVAIIAILLGILICTLIKKLGNADIIDISEYLGGKIFKNFIGVIFIIYFALTSSILLRNFCEGLEIVYFQMTDKFFIILLFVIGMCLANHFGFNASIKVNSIIIPIALFSIIFIFFANFQNFYPQKVFPIWGDGIYNTFITGLINLAAFDGIVFLYFLPPYIEQPEKFKKIAIISLIITGIYLVLCASLILFMFPAFVSTSEIMTLYSATRYISFGTFLQRLESIFMLIWIMSFLGYLSITCKFSIDIFKKITNIKDYKNIINIWGILILLLAILPKNLAISTFFENTIYNYLSIGIIFVLGIGILIIANVKRFRQGR